MRELGVVVRVPDGTRARALSCSFRRRRLQLALKAQPPGGGTSPPLLDVELLCDVVPDGCTWTLARDEGGGGGSVAHLVLEKAESGIFWRALAEGHAEVALPDWWPIAV